MKNIIRIIFSRKGFDSSSGGIPSPIFPDQRILSLPIPHDRLTIQYSHIKWDEYGLGSIVSQLTDRRISSSRCAHLDPDLRHQSLLRADKWRPIFGQTGSAQGHLLKNGVQEGHVFFFFGLFQEVAFKANTIVRNKSAMARHVLWGWLQVGEIIELEKCDRSKYRWAQYHPHLNRSLGRNNTLYVAKEYLNLRTLTAKDRPGAGAFPLFSHELQLTASTAANSSLWELPKWMYPQDRRQPLSYHGNLNRWQTTRSKTFLNAVSRGQEFVLDCSYYPEALEWLSALLTSQ